MTVFNTLERTFAYILFLFINLSKGKTFHQSIVHVLLNQMAVRGILNLDTDYREITNFAHKSCHIILALDFAKVIVDYSTLAIAIIVMTTAINQQHSTNRYVIFIDHVP